MDEEAVLAALDFEVPHVCMWVFDCPNHGIETCEDAATHEIHCSDELQHTSIEVMCWGHVNCVLSMLQNGSAIKFTCPTCKDNVPLHTCMIQPIGA